MDSTRARYTLALRQYNGPRVPAFVYSEPPILTVRQYRTDNHKSSAPRHTKVDELISFFTGILVIVFPGTFFSERVPPPWPTARLNMESELSLFNSPNLYFCSAFAFFKTGWAFPLTPLSVVVDTYILGRWFVGGPSIYLFSPFFLATTTRNRDGGFIMTDLWHPSGLVRLL
ncbi:hypothetical protein B0F90DRAFT_1680519, partial [Multifurca ochricompacta]